MSRWLAIFLCFGLLGSPLVAQSSARTVVRSGAPRPVEEEERSESQHVSGACSLARRSFDRSVTPGARSWLAGFGTQRSPRVLRSAGRRSFQNLDSFLAGYEHSLRNNLGAALRC